ncbi:MAG: GDP-mannose 4,6-dehydratase [candidate division WOR-3 bacterium]
MKVLATGGAGFIGSNLDRQLMSRKGYQIRVLDEFTYAGNLDDFPRAYWKDRRFEFVRADVRDRSVDSEMSYQARQASGHTNQERE